MSRFDSCVTDVLADGDVDDARSLTICWDELANTMHRDATYVATKAASVTAS